MLLPDSRMASHSRSSNQRRILGVVVMAAWLRHAVPETKARSTHDVDMPETLLEARAYCPDSNTDLLPLYNIPSNVRKDYMFYFCWIIPSSPMPVSTFSPASCPTLIR
jgi:hypothetical protein